MSSHIGLLDHSAGLQGLVYDARGLAPRPLTLIGARKSPSPNVRSYEVPSSFTDMNLLSVAISGTRSDAGFRSDLGDRSTDASTEAHVSYREVGRPVICLSPFDPVKKQLVFPTQHCPFRRVFFVDSSREVSSYIPYTLSRYVDRYHRWKSHRYTQCDENTARQLRDLRLGAMAHLMHVAVSSLSPPEFLGVERGKMLQEGESHSGSNPAGNVTWFASVGGERSIHCLTPPPPPPAVRLERHKEKRLAIRLSMSKYTNECLEYLCQPLITSFLHCSSCFVFSTLERDHYLGSECVEHVVPVTGSRHSLHVFLDFTYPLLHALHFVGVVDCVFHVIEQFAGWNLEDLEASMETHQNAKAGKRENPEKTRRPTTAGSSTIPTHAKFRERFHRESNPILSRDFESAHLNREQPITEFPRTPLDRGGTHVVLFGLHGEDGHWLPAHVAGGAGQRRVQSRQQALGRLQSPVGVGAAHSDAAHVVLARQQLVVARAEERAQLVAALEPHLRHGENQTFEKKKKKKRPPLLHAKRSDTLAANTGLFNDGTDTYSHRTSGTHSRVICDGKTLGCAYKPTDAREIAGQLPKHPCLRTRATNQSVRFIELKSSSAFSLQENKGVRLRRQFFLFRRTRGGGKLEIPEKTRLPAASSGTIPTCESTGLARPGSEPGTPWEANRLTARSPRPKDEREERGKPLVAESVRQMERRGQEYAWTAAAANLPSCKEEISTNNCGALASAEGRCPRHHKQGLDASKRTAKEPSEREEPLVIRKIKKDPKIGACKLTAQVLNECGKNVHPEPIRRVIRRAGYNGRVPRKKPFTDEANRRKRFKSAKDHADKDESWWNDL
ncbi:hypothetical protein PR048_029523 [Dryococelus australis]|uniref:Transposase Tc1-like domain-containing protein n=1 Tax=Dryococelus australis TaxID=614101 RepID=A0ABQ9GDL8_9NEOP|nr:hypothetical protein PR048_029523 [Dryococelus australis]